MVLEEAQDIVEDGSPASETNDSRKRPLELDGETVKAKRSNYISNVPNDGNYHLKILVPSIAAGAIIGKGGETIAQLQKETNARVKMSKANDFYPGTTERVCLMTGNVDAILMVLNFIMEKVKEKPDPTSKAAMDFDNKQSAEREKQVKILVPNSTAGMIIGKGGAYIKQIKEDSGAYVQISQKAKDQSLAERCITVISNDLENCKNACIMIVAKIIEDPHSGTCPNVSYADISGPVANPNPTGSPFATSPQAQNSVGMINPLSAVSGLGNLLGGGVNLTLNLSSAFPGGGAGNIMVTGHLLEHVRTQLRTSGFTDQANGEVCQAIGTLINYGIIGLGLGLTNHMNNTNGEYIGNGNNGPFGPIGTTIASGLNLGHGIRPGSPHMQERYTEGAFDPFRRPSGDVSSMSINNTNSFGLGTPLRKSPTPAAESGDGNKKCEMEVGEHIVGAILGPGGKALVEIQHQSATTIQISKKGNYAPGTRNRIVTISGPQTGISAAQYLIEQRIAEEENKRARQHTLMGLG